jgi:hypothetical protein
MSTPRCAAVVLATFLSGSIGASDSPSAIVLLEVTCRESNGVVELQMSLRNTGTRDTAVTLGMDLANGHRYFPDRLTMDVKTSGFGTIREFEYWDPSLPGIAGRVDPWVVPLPHSSEFSITRPLGHFWLNGASLAELSRPFQVRLRLKAQAPINSNLDMAGIAPLNYFSGDLESKWPVIPKECTRG